MLHDGETHLLEEHVLGAAQAYTFTPEALRPA
jgi:hypothetical protein